MKNEYETNEFKLILYYPQYFVKMIKTSKNSSINCLKKSLPTNCEYNFITNGSIVDPDKTFDEIGLKNGQLVVVTKKLSNEFTDNDNNFIKITSDSAFENKIRLFTNKKTRNEIFHLRDVRIFRQEGNIKSYRKLSRNMFLQQSKKNDDDPELNDVEINYDPSSMPCSDAMPIWW